MHTTRTNQDPSLDAVWNTARQHGVSRRSFLSLLGSGGTAAVLAACQSGTSSSSLQQSQLVYPTPETVEAITRAAKSLTTSGMTVEEKLPPDIEHSWETWFRLIAADGGDELKAFLQACGTTEFSPLMRMALAGLPSYGLSTTDLLDRMYRWDMFRSVMLSFMDTYDVLLCPVNADPAPRHGASLNPASAPAFMYPVAYNLTGWPAAVVRAGTSPEGLPIGIQIVSRPWREDLVLAVAQHIESALGGWQRPTI